MRRMVGVLRDRGAAPDAPLAPLAGIGRAGPAAWSSFSRGGARCPAALDGDVDGLPVEVSTSAYRVVMEALTNIRRHAAGRPGRATCACGVPRTGCWSGSADDGAPPRAPPRETRLRAVGLTERVRAIGGRITAGPGIDGGWVRRRRRSPRRRSAPGEAVA